MTRRARGVLIDILRDEGITHVFGNLGSTKMPFMDAPVDKIAIKPRRSTLWDDDA
ncbi:MAG TPA: hypothetical protein VGG86_06635 [Roseiarcus sp.]